MFGKIFCWKQILRKKKKLWKKKLEKKNVWKIKFVERIFVGNKFEERKKNFGKKNVWKINFLENKICGKNFCLKTNLSGSIFTVPAK
jgi:hypothetical protein